MCARLCTRMWTLGVVLKPGVIWGWGHSQSHTLPHTHTAALTHTLCPQVKEVLKTFKEIKNAVDCCNREDLGFLEKPMTLLKFLEKQQSELEICEKALVGGAVCAVRGALLWPPAVLLWAQHCAMLLALRPAVLCHAS